MMLPENIQRHNNNVYEEVIIPLSEPAPIEIGKNLISISTLDEVYRLLHYQFIVNKTNPDI